MQGSIRSFFSLLIAMALVDALVFQFGFFFFYDLKQNWDGVAALKYTLSALWSIIFWCIWSLVGQYVKTKRLYVWGTGVGLCTIVVISLYFKAEFFHLPNINTFLFTIDEPLNTLILIKDKALQLQSLMILVVFGSCLWFCDGLMRRCAQWSQRLHLTTRRYLLVGLLLVFLPISALSLGWHRFAYPLTFDANAARIMFQFGLMMEGNTSNLRHPTRLPVNAVEESPVNVLVILNESLRADALIPGLDFTKTLNPERNAPLFQQLLADPNFFVFREAYANSNTTNVSIPSIMTGLSPDATSTEFHTLPTIWNYAKASKSQTFLFTSQDWTWEHFDHFFFSRDIDHIFHQKSVADATMVNDLGIDDRVTLKKFTQYLNKLDRTRPFFGVLQYNNTHAPFYGGAESLKLEPFSQIRYLSAVNMIDGLIFKAISTVKNFSSDRPTLVFITSDHGEGLKHRKVGRHDNFYEEMVRVPFAIYLHPGTQQTETATKWGTHLNMSSKHAVQNIDIAPTLLALWGIQKDDRLSGTSLVDEIKEPRLITGMGTCEIRKWSPEGFFIRYGHHKLVIGENRRAGLFDLRHDQQETSQSTVIQDGALHTLLKDTIRRTSALSDICERIGEESCEIPTRGSE